MCLPLSHTHVPIRSWVKAEKGEWTYSYDHWPLGGGEQGELLWGDFLCSLAAGVPTRLVVAFHLIERWYMPSSPHYKPPSGCPFVLSAAWKAGGSKQYECHAQPNGVCVFN